MDGPHYACMPLGQWLPSLARAGAAVHAVHGLPRALRPLLEPYPALAPDAQPRGLVVVVGELEEPAVRGVLAAVRPGGWLVELVPRPRGLARTLLALRPDAAQTVMSGYRSCVKWAAVGLCALQQWGSLEPPDLRVTAGRRRGGPVSAG